MAQEEAGVVCTTATWLLCHGVQSCDMERLEIKAILSGIYWILWVVYNLRFPARSLNLSSGDLC